MGQPMEIRCGHCGKGFQIPDAEVGVIYTCPYCATRNRASQPVAMPVTKQPRKARSRYAAISVAVGVVLMAAYLHFRDGDKGGGSAGQSPVINEMAFRCIVDAKSEDFSLSAAKTRTVLAQLEQVIAATEGNPTLDPRIRDFAEMQVEYEHAFGRHVSTEREAYEDPTKVPLELWEMQRRYHRVARDLSSIYAPEWVSSLDSLIAEHDEIIRKLRERR